MKRIIQIATLAAMVVWIVPTVLSAQDDSRSAVISALKQGKGLTVKTEEGSIDLVPSGDKVYNHDGTWRVYASKEQRHARSVCSDQSAGLAQYKKLCADMPLDNWIVRTWQDGSVRAQKVLICHGSHHNAQVTEGKYWLVNSRWINKPVCEFEGHPPLLYPVEYIVKQFPLRPLDYGPAYPVSPTENPINKVSKNVDSTIQQGVNWSGIGIPDSTGMEFSVMPLVPPHLGEGVPGVKGRIQRFFGRAATYYGLDSPPSPGSPRMFIETARFEYTEPAIFWWEKSPKTKTGRITKLGIKFNLSNK